MNDLTKFRSRGERAVITALIQHILGSGNKISVFDGGEWTLKQSRDETAILDALGTTDCDTIRIRDADTKDIKGAFVLVYGNARDGSEIIADYTANEYCETMYRRSIVGII